MKNSTIRRRNRRRRAAAVKRGGGEGAGGSRVGSQVRVVRLVASGDHLLLSGGYGQDAVTACGIHFYRDRRLVSWLEPAAKWYGRRECEGCCRMVGGGGGAGGFSTPGSAAQKERQT
jgi:hypothetical protein